MGGQDIDLPALSAGRAPPRQHSSCLGTTTLPAVRQFTLSRLGTAVGAVQGTDDALVKVEQLL
jgi:hypothetical protein